MERQTARWHRIVSLRLATSRNRALQVPGSDHHSRMGFASSFVHHGEILYGAFHCADGRLRRGLVTLPCTRHSTQAAYTPAAIPSVLVRPPSRTRARRAALETLSVLGWPSVGGYLELAGDVPAVPGRGAASCDVVAAIWAVQDAFGNRLPDEVVARIAVRANRPSDPLMFGVRPVLFAHHEGTVIEDFHCRLPRLSVVGFGIARGGGELGAAPVRYTEEEVARFGELRAMLRSALLARDPRLLGAVATASTTLNQRLLPTGAVDAVRPLVRRVGALGLQIAHRGDIAGLLFDGHDPDVADRQNRADTLLAALGAGDTWRFTVGG